MVALCRDCTFPKTRVPLPACRMWCRKHGFATLALSSPRVTGSTVKGAPSALKHRWHWGEESSTPSSAINLLMTSNKLFNLSRLLLFIEVKAACKTSCLMILIEVGFCGYFTSFLSLLSISSSNASFLLFPTLLTSHARALAISTSSVCVVLVGAGGAVMRDNCCQMGAEGEQQPLGRPGQPKGVYKWSCLLKALLCQPSYIAPRAFFSLLHRMENSAGNSSVCNLLP